ncbi:hypothetical protein MMC22_001665 [Lobaria immixta]|nr:hypothetical protein [Lobaria immixta]
MFYRSLIFTFFLGGFSLAAPTSNNAASTTSAAPIAQSTACGYIVNSGEIVFDAKEVYDCLTSVPFNPAVASRFLKYYNDTLQFQSNLKYLKNPPPSYQEPAVDLIGGLEKIQEDINNALFPNQYTFEAVLQNLIYSAHDAHLTLDAGILSTFSFASPYYIVSVSSDGQQLPKVYVKDDLVGESIGWEPSAIATINGEDATQYLSQFAALNSMGNLEPHADWNQLMSSPALDILSSYSIFEGDTTFYPGKSIALTFENGTQLDPQPWLAYYNSQGDTGPLATGGDFYNFFVLGLYPASYDPDSPSPSSEFDAATSSIPIDESSASDPPQPTTTSWLGLSDAYPPNPDISQPSLSAGGVLTGYFLHEIQTAVLSIPSFEAYDDDIIYFTVTISKFLEKSKAAGMKKILIDVQQNSGGNTFLAIDAFKQFFPDIDPFGGSRLRAHPAADVLGNTFTQDWDTPGLNQSYYYSLSVNEWVATDLLNADTGRNFTSWGEFYGPHMYDGDYFTTSQRYNLSSSIYDVMASGAIVVYGYGNRPATSPQPYASEDIAILSDGICSSACSLFMEMMHHEAGVRTIAAGGLPGHGPMQTPSGSRGAQSYTVDNLNTDIAMAKEINGTAGSFLPERQEDVFISYASFNLRDQVRKGENTPLQFVYEAASCRIFYTKETVYNFGNLWRYAANAIWTKPALCVQGSTGITSGGNSSDISGPPAGSSRVNPNIIYNITTILELSGAIHEQHPDLSTQQLDTSRERMRNVGDSCVRNEDCGSRLDCHTVHTCGGMTSKKCAYSCTSLSKCHCIHANSHVASSKIPKAGYKGYCELPAQCDARSKNADPDAPRPYK